MIDAAALRWLLLVLTRWLERREREVVAYLVVENRLLRRQLGTRRIRLTAALSEESFGISKAQTEPVVEPDGVTDDFGRKSVAVVAGGKARHQPTLPAAAST